MKQGILIIGLMLGGCVLTDSGVTFNPPKPNVVVCLNAVSDDEAEQMKQSIKNESFEDSRLTKAKNLSKDRCFRAHHVVTIMGAFSFEDSKLEIAKFLYGKTENQQDYELVVDALTFESDKDELRDYIMYFQN